MRKLARRCVTNVHVVSVHFALNIFVFLSTVRDLEHDIQAHDCI